MANLSHLTKLLAAFDVQEEAATDFESKHANLKVVVTPSPVSKIDPVNRRVQCGTDASGEVLQQAFLCNICVVL